MPADGRVIEGALHPLSLRPNSRAMIVTLAFNVVFFIFISVQAITMSFRGAGGAGPNVPMWMLVQAAVMGCMVVTFGWEVWRRSRFARRSASAHLAGREIRWIVGPTGLECIDRSKPLKQPKRTRVEAARMYRVTGTAEDAGATASRSDATPDRDGKRPSTRLGAWSWTLDGNGRRTDLVPRAMFTLPHAMPEPIAAELGRILGLPPDAASRPLPWAPFSDTRAWFRYFQVVMLTAMIVTFIGVMIVPREWMYLWFVGAILVTSGLIQGSRMAMDAWRRRWVRGRAGVP